MKRGSNKEIISESLIDEISKDISENFKNLKDFRGLLGKTQKLLKKVIKLEKKWEAAKAAQLRNPNTFINSKGEVTIHKTGEAFKALENDPNKRLQYNDVVRIIIEAELFLDEVRKFFTDQTITYSVGLTYYGKLYEYNLTLLDMLKNAVINIDSKTQGLKLRIAKSKGELIKAYGTLQIEERKGTIDKEYAEKNIDEILYQKLRQYWLKSGKQLHQKTVNEGVLYETYRYYLAKGVKDIDITNSADLDFYEEAIIRSMNSTSGRQGGDVGNAQVKFVNASFATLSNIKRTLQELAKLLNDFIKNNSKEEFSFGIKNLFTKKDKDIEDIEKNMQADAKDNIDQIIKTLPNIKLI